MSTALSPLLSRGLAVSILLFLLSLAYSSLVDPWIAARREQAQASDDMAATQARFAALRTELAARHGELEDLKRRQAARNGFLEGGSDAVLAAQLQNRIKSVVDRAHGEVKSMQVLQSREEAHFRRISVRGQIAASTAALQKIIYDLEGGTPYLFLDNVQLRAPPALRQRDPTHEDVTLDIRFDLLGYARGPS